MANEFIIKNGYFSQGNSNVTGSISVTQNITASKALFSSSNGDQLTVIGSGSTIAQIYGSQGNLLTVNDTFSGSIFTISDLSGYPILDITSDYVTGSVFLPMLQSQSQQHVVVYNSASGLLTYISASEIGGGSSIPPFPYTGSAEITGSLIVSGGFIVHSLNPSGHTVIDSITGVLYDDNGTGSINYSGRQLIEETGNEVVNWGSQILNDTNAVLSIDWNERKLYADNGTSIQIHWDDNAGIKLPSVDTNPIEYVLGIDNLTNRFIFYTASSALGGGGSGIPGGLNRQVQFNANGTSFSGSSNFTFDSSSNTLTVTGSVTVSGSGTFTNIGPARFTGSIDVTGSLTVTGSINTTQGGFTGSLFGTASYVSGSIFTSTNPALSASYALSASFAPYNSTSSVIGDGALTTWNINHGFGTRNLHITVYESGSNGETVYPDIRRINENTASIVFANPPTSLQYIVYVSQ